MNQFEFSRKVADRTKGIGKDTVDIAIKAFGDRNVYLQEDVESAVSVASSLSLQIGHRPANGKQEQVEPPGSRERIDSAAICDALEPKVEQLRLRFFESKKPPLVGTSKNPLAGVEKIRDWLKARAVRPLSSPKPAEGQVHRLMQELRTITGMQVGLHWAEILFPAKDVKTGQWRSESLAVPTDSAIYDLARELAVFGNAPGFSRTSLTAWVFSGIRPIIPRITVSSGLSWSEGMPAPRWNSQITINARDVTWDELWKVYRSVRGSESIQRRKLNPLHERICQLVRQEGGPPTTHGDKEAFWEKIRKTLQREKQFNSVPGTWNAIKKAYRAATKKGVQ